MKARIIDPNKKQRGQSVQLYTNNAFESNGLKTLDMFKAIKEAEGLSNSIKVSIKHYEDVFTHEDGFSVSPKFNKYVENTTKTLDNFLRQGYSIIEDDDSSLKSVSLYRFFNHAVYNGQIRKLNETKGLSSEFSGELTYFEYICSHSIWNTEKTINDTLGDVPQDSRIMNVIHVCLEPEADMSGNPYAFKGVLDSVIKHVCLEFISYKAIQENSNITPVNFVDTAALKSDADIIFFIKRVYEYLKTEVENMAAFLLLNSKETEESPYEASSEFQLIGKVDELKAQIKTLAKALETETENKIKSDNKYEATISQMNQEIKALKESISKANKVHIKAENERIHELNSELKRQKEENEALSKKYEQLLKFTEMLENSETEDNPEENVLDADALTASFRNKRIVFVRKDDAAGYPIMKRLEEYFPNSSFTNGITSSIDKANTDLVIALTKYISHSAYYKTRDECRNAGVEYIHCERSGFNGAIRTISNVLNKRGE